MPDKFGFISMEMETTKISGTLSGGLCTAVLRIKSNPKKKLTVQIRPEFSAHK